MIFYYIIIQLFASEITSFHFDNNSDEVDRIHTSLLYGGVDLGYYYVNIYIGTPPTRQTVIVDTGSSITTFPCNDCGLLCGQHFNHQFEYQLSSTSEAVKCHEQLGRNSCQKCDEMNRCSFTVNYAENSELKGYYIRDFILFGDALFELFKIAPTVQSQQQKDFNETIEYERFKTVFGCTTYETNLFRTQKADGILGLSPRVNSFQALPNIIDDLYFSEEAKGEELQFSICLGVEGGYISLGGYDKHRHPINAQTYTIRYERDAPTYRININKIILGGQELAIEVFDFDKGHGSFIDSGTTLVYADDKIYNEFMKTFSWYCQQNRNHCPNMQRIDEQLCFQYEEKKLAYQNIQEFYKLFPTIDFQLDNGFNFDWRPEDYLYKETYLTSKTNIYCFPVNKFPNRFILGSIWMRNWDILFDRQKKQISFTRTQCSNEKVHLNIIDHQNATSNETLIIGDEEIIIETQIKEKQHQQNQTQLDGEKNDQIDNQQKEEILKEDANVKAEENLTEEENFIEEENFFTEVSLYEENYFEEDEEFLKKVKENIEPMQKDKVNLNQEKNDTENGQFENYQIQQENNITEILINISSFENFTEVINSTTITNDEKLNSELNLSQLFNENESKGEGEGKGEGKGKSEGKGEEKSESESEKDKEKEKEKELLKQKANQLELEIKSLSSILYRYKFKEWLKIFAVILGVIIAFALFYFLKFCFTNFNLQKLSIYNLIRKLSRFAQFTKIQETNEESKQEKTSLKIEEQELEELEYQKVQISNEED